MKKRLLALVLTVFITGCSNQNNNSQSADPSISIAATDVSTTSNVPNESVDTLDYIEFNGLGKSTNETVYGNLTINNKSGNYNAIFCVDTEGVIYYTNFNDNGCLYKLESGKQSKLTDIPACFINNIGDEIYFISPTGKIGDYSSAGAIYRINKENNICEIFIEEKATALTVTSDGAYYTLNEIVNNGDSTIVTPMMYLYSFEDNSTKPFDFTYLLQYGNYHLIWEKDEGVYSMTDGSTSIVLCAETKLIYNACIYSGKLYSSYKNFRVIDLESGDETVYDQSEFSSFFGGSAPEISGYTVIDDCIYLAFESGLICQIDNSGIIKASIGKNSSNITISELYTDGVNLYGLSEHQLFRLSFDDEGFYTPTQIGE